MCFFIYYRYDHILRYWTVRYLPPNGQGVLSILGIIQFNSVLHYIQYYSLPIITALITPIVKLVLSVLHVYGILEQNPEWGKIWYFVCKFSNFWLFTRNWNTRLLKSTQECIVWIFLGDLLAVSPRCDKPFCIWIYQYRLHVNHKMSSYDTGVFSCQYSDLNTFSLLLKFVFDSFFK